MSGDISRNTFKRWKHYSEVLLQQGRVALDADANEQIAIQKHLRRTALTDVIGCCGVPENNAGFGVDFEPIGSDPGAEQFLTLTPGRLYCGGILCELEATPLNVISFPSNKEVELTALTVDGRELDEDQWVEISAGGVTQLLRITGIASSPTPKLTLHIDVDSLLRDMTKSPQLRRIVTYDTQPDYPGYPAPTGLELHPDDSVYLAYLDIWSRDITAVEDPQLREVALQGPDTATRTQTIQQVKLLKLGDEVNNGNADCKDYACPSFPQGWGGDATLRARSKPGEPTEHPCVVPATAGYRRLENQLYRVEIHHSGSPHGWRPSSPGHADVHEVVSVTPDSEDATEGEITLAAWTSDYWQVGQVVELYSAQTENGDHAAALFRITAADEEHAQLTLAGDDSLDPNAALSAFGNDTLLRLFRVATFKWSRENGSLVFSIEEKPSGSNNQLKVSSLGRDDVLSLSPNDWVELSNDAIELQGVPGFMMQIAGEGINEEERTITFTADIPSGFDLHGGHPKLRRWDQDSNVLAVRTDSDWNDPDDAIKLESGVQIQFDGTHFVSGDYWQIPARTATGDVEWPQDEPAGQPLWQSPVGIKHHYCALALLQYHGANWSVLKDCRNIFPPLIDISGGCCLKVEPGEDLQTAINTVIAAGGGTVCLCKGVHIVEGPLLIRQAHQLKITGEDSAATLWLRSGASDFGGIFVEDCNRLSFENLFIMSDDAAVSDLISINQPMAWPPDPIPSLASVVVVTPSRHIRLRRVTMLGQQCAVQAAAVDDIAFEDCRMVASVGFQSVGWADVTALRMKGVNIRYSVWGISARGCTDWKLHDCDIRSDRDSISALQETAQQDMSDEQFCWLLLSKVDKLVVSAPSTYDGVAVSACSWDSCIASGCHLRGITGLRLHFFEGGSSVTDCTVEASHYGLSLGAMSKARVCDNLVDCPQGGGLYFWAADGADIERNRIIATTGIANQMFASVLSDLEQELGRIIATHPYEISDESPPGPEGPILPPPLSGGQATITEDRLKAIALWWLLEEGVRILGLEEVRGKAQMLFERLGHDRFPLLYMTAVRAYPKLMDPTQFPEIPLPIMELEVRGNHIEGSLHCVNLTGFVSMGNIVIADNHLTVPPTSVVSNISPGPAVCIAAAPTATSTGAVTATVRNLFTGLARQVAPALSVRIDGSALGDEVKVAANDLFAAVAGKLLVWTETLESLADIAHRIEGNVILSTGTAIDCNLLDVAILNNEISVTELDGFVADDFSKIRNVFSANIWTRPLAVAMRDGFPISTAEIGVRLLPEDEVLSDPAVRAEVGAVFLTAATGLTDERLRRTSSDLGIAVDTGNVEDTHAHLKELADMLQAQSSSFGVYLKSANCRVIGNRISASKPTATTLWPRGGVNLWGGEAEWGYADFARDMLGLTGAPPSSLPETIIDGNEILAGWGHGVEIQGLDLADLASLHNIKISNNQIRGMGGAGVMINEGGLASGIDIEHNLITDCTANAELIALFDADDKRGGIVSTGARMLRIHNNRITRCGMNQVAEDLFGVNLEWIEGLSLENNYVSYNGRFEGQSFDPWLNGGIRLYNIHGPAAVNNNEMLSNRGIPLWWKGSSYSQFPHCLGSVQGNRIEVQPGLAVPAVCLAFLWQVNFSGNNYVPGRHRFGGRMHGVEYAVINHNIIETVASETYWALYASGLGRAAIVGNVSGPQVAIKAYVRTGFGKEGLNVPDATIVNY